MRSTPPRRISRLIARTAALLALGLTIPATVWSAPPTFETQTFAYRPPEREPKGLRTRYIDEPPDFILERIWAFLEESGLSIASVDPQQRIIVAQYSGDPRPYVDCGEVVPLINGVPAEQAKPFSAAKQEVRTAKTVNKRRYGLLRRLALDIRLTVQVEPRGRGARVYSQAIYVATKTSNRIYKGGRPGELLDREVVSFMSNTIGRFDKGTECVATGKIETLPLAPFKRSS